jgi:hypothetical protein
LFDAGEDGSWSFGFIDAHVCEIKDVVDQLGCDGIDEGAGGWCPCWIG